MDSDLPLATELSAVFARMAGRLLAEDTVESALREVTRLAVETIPPSIGAAASLMDTEGTRTTAGASDPLVLQLDERQYELGEGPCIAAWSHRAPVRIDDTFSDDRWPRWCEEAREAGVRSVLSVPLETTDRVLGAMKLYSEQPAAYDRTAERRLAMFAGQAAILLESLLLQDGEPRLGAGLTKAARGRELVSMAKGYLMSRHAVGEDEASRLLRGEADAKGQDLPAAAERLLFAADGR